MKIKMATKLVSEMNNCKKLANIGKCQKRHLGINKGKMEEFLYLNQTAVAILVEHPAQLKH